MSAKSPIPLDKVVGRRVRARRLQSVYPNELSAMRWEYPISKSKSTNKASAELEPVACNRLQKFSMYPFPCFSTKNSVDRNTEVPCSHSSTPPIRFVSLRHLRGFRIVASSSALWNWSNKSPTGTALTERS